MNTDGSLVLSTYGRIATAHVDTIEKKPAHHYRPGSKLLSIGTVGCNWSCEFCLNSQISQIDAPAGKSVDPRRVVSLANQYKCQGIAYTYNEPLVFMEFARDIGMLAHEAGLFNVVVTNGYGTAQAVNAMLDFADCITVGLKASASPSFLRKHAGVQDTKPIFETLRDLKRRPDIHVEISDLVFSQDGEYLRETRSLCSWISKEMGVDTPLHFVMFHPAYKMNSAPKTSSEVLDAHCEVARQEGLRYVYVANFPGHRLESTYCPCCGTTVISRFGYGIQVWHLDEQSRCRSCGNSIPIVGTFTETPPEERYAPVIFPPMDMLYVCEGLAG
jgi:pyruvate formate lyase activating enzyme